MHTDIRLKLALFLALALTVASVSPVAAQEDEIPPCAGDSVSGTVVAVDEETGEVTVHTAGGLCTVTLDGEYDHPIVDLLGSYFGDVSAESLIRALEATQGCAVYDPDSEAWTWADCDDEDAVAVTIVGENEDGTFTALVDGEEVQVSVEDLEVAERLSEALDKLVVEWKLGEDGTVVQPGDEIAAYHEDGLGFGVLVKLYAIAAASQEGCDDEESTEPCGVTVEELVEAFRSGMGLGDLFREYGRPSILGVGHVRNGRGGRAGRGNRAGRAGWSDDSPDGDADDDDSGPPEHAGRPDHAGPKENTGPPDHAGPKDKPGRPDRAGPKKAKKK
ncbi:MAG: hypothetical protein GWN58_10010 [Anaerolineae bacterium]|nr:hypothetical protein [Anaerolineae bacterium]